MATAPTWGSNLRLLVERVLRETDVPRLRLSSLEPWDLPRDFAELWQDPRLMPHLHLPLQSGCDRTLRKMARRCLTDAYARLVEQLRGQISDLHITTDLIVGFPGETDTDFGESLAFVRSIGFSHVHVFPFSPRTGTRAATLPGPIPGDQKRARSQAAHELAAHMKAQAVTGAVGQVRSVLWESGVASDGGLSQFAGYHRQLSASRDGDAREHRSQQSHRDRGSRGHVRPASRSAAGPKPAGSPNRRARPGPAEPTRTAGRAVLGVVHGLFRSIVHDCWKLG